MLRRLIATLLLVLLPSIATPQHNHSHGHNDYQGWSSSKVGNCCNNDDCGELREDEIRETPIGPEVKIAGEWCPVGPEHFTIRGKSPDASVAHACVGKTEYWQSVEPCKRLLCFMRPGGS